jgi:predicted DsbA family dithiol-disulfide isomerase
MNTTSDKMIEITEFTDPVCTWCWGSEPALRKLATRFGEQHYRIAPRGVYLGRSYGRGDFLGTGRFC